MCARTLTAAALVALVAPRATADDSFSFRDFLSGTWEIERTSVSLTTSETVPVSKGTYVFAAEEGTGNVAGRYIQNSTASADDMVDDVEDAAPEAVPILVEFETAVSGAFKTGSDEDLLFNFFFQEYQEYNMMSAGEYNGQVPGYYQFQVLSRDRFTITLYPAEPGADPELTVISARLKKDARERTFFERYGSTIMMLGLFMLFQNMKPAQPPRAEGPPTAEEKRRGGKK